MLTCKEKIKVGTLSDLRKKVLEVYHKSIEIFMNADDSLIKSILDSAEVDVAGVFSNEIQTLTINPVIDYMIWDLKGQKYEGSLENNSYISGDHKLLKYTKKKFGFDSENYPVILMTNKKDIEELKEDVMYYLDSRIENRSYCSAVKRSFFYPIINQDDLFVIGQFNFDIYLSIDKEGNYHINFSPSEGFVNNYNTKYDNRSVFIVSKKHNLRYINPNNEKMILSHNMPERIRGMYRRVNFASGFINQAFYPLSSKYIINSDLINEKMQEFILNEIDQEDVMDGVYDASKFFEVFINYKPKGRAYRSGVEKYLPVMYSDDEIVERISDITRKTKKNIYLSESIGSNGPLNWKDREVSFGNYVKTVKSASFKNQYKCVNCNNLGYFDGYVYDLGDDDLLSRISGFSSQNSGRAFIDDDIYCSKCGNLVVEKDFFKSRTGVHPDYAISDFYVVLYDHDGNGRLIERIFTVSVPYNDEEFSIEESYRVILPRRKNKRIDIYEKDWENSKFEKSDYFSGRLTDVIFLQNKSEVVKVLNETDYKYSGFEEILSSELYGTNHKVIGYSSSYMRSYIKNPKLELLARLSEDFSFLLVDIIEDGYEDLLDPSASNLKGFLKLSNNTFNIFKKTERTFDDLLNIHDLFKHFGDCLTYDIYLALQRNGIDNRYTISILSGIIDNYNITLSGAISYIERVKRYQRIVSTEEILNIWSSYLKKSVAVGRDIRDSNVRFPDSLKREYDIVVYDYNVINDEKVFEASDNELDNFANLKKLEFKNDKYVVIAPSNRQDIVFEGNRQNHCIATYAEDVAKGLTRVMFLRKIKNLHSSLYTILIDDNYKISEIRGKNNNPLTDFEVVSFLYDYQEYLFSIK